MHCSFRWLALFLMLLLVASCSSGGGDDADFSHDADDDQHMPPSDDDEDDDGSDDDQIGDDDAQDDDGSDDDQSDDDGADDDAVDDDAVDDDAVDDDATDDDVVSLDLEALLVGDNALLMGMEVDTHEIVELDLAVNADMERWNDVWFRNGDEAWVVGETVNDQGAILLYRNNQFTRYYIPSVKSQDWTLLGVAFPTNNRGYAVGADYQSNEGIILEYNSQDDSWEQETELPAGLPGCWYASAATALLLGETFVAGGDCSVGKGLILRRKNDFVNWKILSTPDIGQAYELHHLSLNNSNDGWAVGDGILLKWNGLKWSRYLLMPGLDENVYLRRVECTGQYFCYAAGYDAIARQGVVYKHEVFGWSRINDQVLQNSGDYGDDWWLWGIAMGGPYEATFVGAGKAVVISYDGSSWNQLPPNPDLFGSHSIRSIGVAP